MVGCSRPRYPTRSRPPSAPRGAGPPASSGGGVIGLGMTASAVPRNRPASRWRSPHEPADVGHPVHPPRVPTPARGEQPAAGALGLAVLLPPHRGRRAEQVITVRGVHDRDAQLGDRRPDRRAEPLQRLGVHEVRAFAGDDLRHPPGHHRVVAVDQVGGQPLDRPHRPGGRVPVQVGQRDGDHPHPAHHRLPVRPAVTRFIAGVGRAGAEHDHLGPRLHQRFGQQPGADLPPAVLVRPVPGRDDQHLQPARRRGGGNRVRRGGVRFRHGVPLRRDRGVRGAWRGGGNGAGPAHHTAPRRRTASSNARIPPKEACVHTPVSRRASAQQPTLYAAQATAVT